MGTVKNRVHAYLLMNNKKIDYSPFTKGFFKELRKVKDARVEGLLLLPKSGGCKMYSAGVTVSFN